MSQDSENSSAQADDGGAAGRACPGVERSGAASHVMAGSESEAGESSPQPALQHPDGVYFGLDESLYHSDGALGSTDLRAILRHPAQYWWQSKMNPLRPERKANYLDWGRAFHSLILEGREAFERRYYRGPSKADYPSLLDTTDQMKAWLAARGYVVTGLKAKLMERVLQACAERNESVPIWETIQSEAQAIAQGRHILPPADFDTILLSRQMIIKNPHVAPAFEDGCPEVSVFWTTGESFVLDEGMRPIRRKARIDFLKYHSLTDLKSCRPWQERSFDESIYLDIRYRKYSVQAVHYLDAREQVPALVKAGKVFGDHSSAWVDRLAIADLNKVGYCWVFYQAAGAPIAKRFNFRRGNKNEMLCRDEIAYAVKKYTDNLEVFGRGIWPDVSPPSWVDDEDLYVR